MKPRLRKSVAAVAVALVVALWNAYGDRLITTPGGGGDAATGDQLLQAAFRDQRSDVQVEGEGRVIRVLRDDNDGSRHQRFLLETGSGLSLLVAHNIDLAPRIPDLETGDRVRFFGEYEWNDRGGVIHWTHHDPRGRHVGGWLDHEGSRYE